MSIRDKDKRNPTFTSTAGSTETYANLSSCIRMLKPMLTCQESMHAEMGTIKTPTPGSRRPR